MKTIQSYKPEIKTVPQARLLLVGPVGAGKSSFFNSINSAFRGNMTCQAIAGTGDKSVTTQVQAQVLVFFPPSFTKNKIIIKHWIKVDKYMVNPW